LAARQSRVYNHAIADAERIRSLSQLRNHGDKFVSQNERGRWHKWSTPTMREVMYVGAANASTAHAKQYFANLWRGAPHRIKAQVAGTVQNCG